MLIKKEEILKRTIKIHLDTTQPLINRKVSLKLIEAYVKGFREVNLEEWT